MKTFLDGPSIGRAPSVLAFFPCQKNGRKGGLESVNNHVKKFPEKIVWECHRKRVFPSPNSPSYRENGVFSCPSRLDIYPIIPSKICCLSVRI